MKNNKSNNGNKNDNKVPLRIKFLILMVLIYIITFIFDKSFVINSLNDFWALFIKILPIILVVYVMMFVVNLFVSNQLIERHVGKESGLMGWFWVVLTAIVVPSPPYIIFPLLSDMEKKGMRVALIVTFLYSRNLQIAFLPVMAYYFGLKFTIVISFFVFVFAILSGLLMERLMMIEKFKN